MPQVLTKEENKLAYELIRKARAAMTEIENWDQKQLDRLAQAIGWFSGNQKTFTYLAQMGVDESGIGDRDGRPAKRFKIQGVLRDALRQKSVGLVEEDKLKGIKKYAKPAGVVASLIPMTNPALTPPVTGIYSAKARNAVIFSPHPRSAKTTYKMVEVMRSACREVYAPEDLFQCIKEPTIPLTKLLMQECDLTLATGGSNMVEAAYSSGKPAYGVGAGNSSIVIDETADVDIAASNTKTSKVSDFGSGCSADGNIIIHKSIYSKMIKSLEKEGGYLCNSQQKSLLETVMWNEKGRKTFYQINTKTDKYETYENNQDKELLDIKKEESLDKRIVDLVSLKTKHGDFYRSVFYDSFRYCSLRIPEVSDDIYKIDKAICSGFGWKKGPFETWDAIGVEKVFNEMLKLKLKPAPWVEEMLSLGIKSFYKFSNNKKHFYDIKEKQHKPIPGSEGLVVLDAFKENDVVWSNKGVTLYDIKDGVLNLEFHTKMNTMGKDVLEGINYAIDICEKQYTGLVIANEADYFSAGADLGTVFMLAGNRDFESIEKSIDAFQKTIMKVRYSSVPVVVATSGLALGGACELSMHADAVQAHNETYMGLVELGAGLIPAGGGTKETVLRVSSEYSKGDPEFNKLMDSFMTIASAKVSTSALEAQEMGFFKKTTNTANRTNLIKDAKNQVLNIASLGYVKPTIKKKIKVHGRSALAMFNAGIETMKQGMYITEYDQKLAQKLAHIMCGGDLTQECYVDEQYLLDLERETMVSLCGEEKTLQRMHSILFKRKPLRN